MRAIALLIVACHLGTAGCKKKEEAASPPAPVPDYSSPKAALITYFRAVRNGDTVEAMNAVTADAKSQEIARIMSTWMGGFQEANAALRARQLPDITAMGLDERVPVVEWIADMDKSIQASYEVDGADQKEATVRQVRGQTSYHLRNETKGWKLDLSVEQVYNTMNERGHGYRALAKAVSGGSIQTADEAKAYYDKACRELYR